MWGYAALRCPACGTPAAPDFVFCHWCGEPLRTDAPYSPAYRVYYPPAGYPARHPVATPSGPPPGRRTRMALALGVGALVMFALPFVAPLGAVLLSISSTLLFADRRGFSPAHRSATALSYALFWAAAVLYGILLGAYLVQAYVAWRAFEPMAALGTETAFFIAATTVPTGLLATALGLQIRFLLPPGLRPLVRWCVLALVLLVLLATYLGLRYVPSDLAPGGIHVATVAGVLNQVSLTRAVEVPGFLGLACLYARARGNVVPQAAVRPEPGREG